MNHIRPKILIASNTSWNLYNFRAGLVRSYVAAGYDVVVISSPDEYVPHLTALGCRFIPLFVDCAGTSVWTDIVLFFRFWFLLRRERPSLFLGYTIKPNIYGSLAAAILAIPIVNNIAGLGEAFTKQTVLTYLVEWLYRLALKKSVIVFFQNIDDLRYFTGKGVVNVAQAQLLPGSGVDLTHFAPPVQSDDIHQRPLRFLLVSRLLWSKGVGEYVKAARIVQAQFPHAEFQILGSVEKPSKRAVSRSTIDQWVSDGVVHYLGVTDDVRPFLTAADCVVLPSYYKEGTPRSLLEAAAMSRPIITTNSVGCRDVVDDGVNGFICKPIDPNDLADKILAMIKLAPDKRVAMGLAGRAKVVRQFDEQIVINAYLQVTKQFALAGRKPKILICLNMAWNLVNFRAGLIRALVAQGYDVVTVAPFDEYAQHLPALGCRYLVLPMKSQSTSPVHDSLLLWRFVRLLAKEQPDVYLGYTIKPNLYGSLAAHLLGVPVINNIAGLGTVFIENKLMVPFLPMLSVQRVVRWLYRTALKRSVKVFFQNNDDRQLFINDGLVRPEVTDVLPGSGIDLIRFRPKVSPVNLNENSKFRFLLIARMLRDKGVGEYVKAAKLLRQRWPLTEFCLLGFVDVQNPSAISTAEIDDWMAHGVVNYLGVSDDVRSEIATADCVVLPSYREGTPRTLLEAAAMARPIITTDVAGCREVVEEGVNGYLCQVRDAADLAAKMEQMLSLSPKQRFEMGLRGRAKMEAEFDEQIVIDKYLATIRQLTDQYSPRGSTPR